MPLWRRILHTWKTQESFCIVMSNGRHSEKYKMILVNYWCTNEGKMFRMQTYKICNIFSQKHCLCLFTERYWNEVLNVELLSAVKSSGSVYSFHMSHHVVLPGKFFFAPRTSKSLLASSMCRKIMPTEITNVGIGLTAHFTSKNIIRLSNTEPASRTIMDIISIWQTDTSGSHTGFKPWLREIFSRYYKVTAVLSQG